MNEKILIDYYQYIVFFLNKEWLNLHSILAKIH